MLFPCPEAIDRRYGMVFVSPHFDDAVIACGGLVRRRIKAGRRALIATIFSADAPEKKKPHGDAFSGITNTAGRRREEAAALQRLGADGIWLPYADAVYRLQRPFLRYAPVLFGRRYQRLLIHRLRSDLMRIAARSGCRVLCLPMGIGQHIDHRLVFEAGVSLAGSIDIWLYEDHPYALFPFLLQFRAKCVGLRMPRRRSGSGPAFDKTAAVDRLVDLLTTIPSLQLNHPRLKKPLRLLIRVLDAAVVRRMPILHGPLYHRRCRPLVVDVTPHVEIKLDAILSYQSQLAGPFATRNRIRQAMQIHSSRLQHRPQGFFERYWRLRP